MASSIAVETLDWCARTSRSRVANIWGVKLTVRRFMVPEVS
jgi:hypothetical protein